MICAIKSNRKLADKQLSQWSQTLRHQRYQRVQLTATDQRLQTYLVRTLRGKLTKLSFEVCVLISHRHPRDKHPGFHVRRDKLPSIAYSEELISFAMSTSLQSTDRHHGIVGQKRCYFQLDS